MFMKTIVIGGFILALIEVLIAMLMAWGRQVTVAIYFLIAAGITAGLAVILMIVQMVIMEIKLRKMSR